MPAADNNYLWGLDHPDKRVSLMLAFAQHGKPAMGPAMRQVQKLIGFECEIRQLREPISAIGTGSTTYQKRHFHYLTSNSQCGLWTKWRTGGTLYLFQLATGGQDGASSSSK
jgi:hypothetical protein